MEREVAGAKLLADRAEIEVEAVDGADLRKPGVLDAPIYRALEAAGPLLVAKAMEDLEAGEIVGLRLREHARDEPSHAGQAQRAQLRNQQAEGVVVVSGLLGHRLRAPGR